MVVSTPSVLRQSSERMVGSETVRLRLVEPQRDDED
jgi:hypothetical protein